MRVVLRLSSGRPKSESIPYYKTVKFRQASNKERLLKDVKGLLSYLSELFLNARLHGAKLGNNLLRVRRDCIHESSGIRARLPNARGLTGRHTACLRLKFAPYYPSRSPSPCILSLLLAPSLHTPSLCTIYIYPSPPSNSLSKLSKERMADITTQDT